jgi:hypothetical protein
MALIDAIKNSLVNSKPLQGESNTMGDQPYGRTNIPGSPNDAMYRMNAGVDELGNPVSSQIKEQVRRQWIMQNFSQEEWAKIAPDLFGAGYHGANAASFSTGE